MGGGFPRRAFPPFLVTGRLDDHGGLEDSGGHYAALRVKQPESVSVLGPFPGELTPLDPDHLPRILDFSNRAGRSLNIEPAQEQGGSRCLHKAAAVQTCHGCLTPLGVLAGDEMFGLSDVKSASLAAAIP